MDLKTDDALNVDIDPAIILSYELDKLTLDSIPNDIFDEIKLTDESPKNDDKIDAINDFLAESTFSNCTVIKMEKTSTVGDESCDAEIKSEIPSEYSEIKKDINGNDESVSEENLNELFVRLELTDESLKNDDKIDDKNDFLLKDNKVTESVLSNCTEFKIEETSTAEDKSESDSDNEEIDDPDHITKRGPVRASKSRRDHRKKDAINVWCKTVDKTQLNSESLKFWSGGSSQIQFSENAVPNQYALYNNSQATIYDGIEPINNLSNVESYFDDARAISVSSPESGYDSSAHSIAGSPPPFLFTSANLDFIPETVDDQNLLEFLINTDSALIDYNLDERYKNDEDAKSQIKKILNFLKDMPPESSESSNATTISHNLIEPVPFSNHSTVSSTSVLKPSPVSTTSDLKSVSFNAVSKHVEIKPKLEEKAKAALKTFLSEEEYHDAKKRIYAKIREDKESRKQVSVIYVEDEMDKDSKNRTNLHNAVINGKIEDVFSIIEINKQYRLSFAGINIRDKCGKTALDYAIENKMTLVADYLKENTACQSVNL